MSKISASTSFAREIRHYTNSQIFGYLFKLMSICDIKHDMIPDFFDIIARELEFKVKNDNKS